MGLNGDPCGTPLVIGNESEMLLPIFTDCFRLYKISDINFTN